MTYKATNLHSLSHEQYFSTGRFLNICPWVFKPFQIFEFLICERGTDPYFQSGNFKKQLRF